MPEEHAAGFRARLANIANREVASMCWRCGWDDADTELLETACDRQAMEEGREDGYAGTRPLLFDAGLSACENGVPFDEARTVPWNRAGSRPTSGSRPPFNYGEAGAKVDALPLRAQQGRRARTVRNFLHTRAAGWEHFGGMHEAVPHRDGRRCRVCDAPGRRKLSILVHHRVPVPGVSEMALMISLCPKHHAIVERTQVVFSAMSPLLLELWREKHPRGHEQTIFDFSPPAMKPAPHRLFLEEDCWKRARAVVPTSVGFIMPAFLDGSSVTHATDSSLHPS